MEVHRVGHGRVVDKLPEFDRICTDRFEIAGLAFVPLVVVDRVSGASRRQRDLFGGPEVDGVGGPKLGAVPSESGSEPGEGSESMTMNVAATAGSRSRSDSVWFPIPLPIMEPDSM